MWIVDSVAWVYRALDAVHGVVTVLTVLVIFPMLIFRWSRAAGAVSLNLVSFYWLALLWTQSFLYLIGNSAWVLLIMGVLVGFLGVVPAALIYSGFHLDWPNFGLIILALAGIAGMKYLSFRCMLKAAPKP